MNKNLYINKSNQIKENKEKPSQVTSQGLLIDSRAISK